MTTALDLPKDQWKTFAEAARKRVLPAIPPVEQKDRQVLLQRIGQAAEMLKTQSNSNTWHRDLLTQMSAKTDIRPAVISQQHGKTLDEYRRFRHLVRNLYTNRLQPDKIEGLVRSLPDLWAGVKAELLAFADFLDYLDQSYDQ